MAIANKPRRRTEVMRKVTISVRRRAVCQLVKSVAAYLFIRSRQGKVQESGSPLVTPSVQQRKLFTGTAGVPPAVTVDATFIRKYFHRDGRRDACGPSEEVAS